MGVIWNKYQGTIKKIIFIIGFFLILYLSIKFLFPLFAPFLIAIIISYINEPVIKLLERFRLSRKIAAVVSLLFTISVLGVLITLCFIKFYNELVILQQNWNTYSDVLSAQVNDIILKATKIYHNLPSGISSSVYNNLDSISKKISTIIGQIISYAFGALSSIPSLTVFIIVTLLSTYFISSDKKSISSFLYKQLPFSWRKNLTKVKKDTLNALLGYFKALLILMGLTFVEVSVGLFILNVRYAFLIALLVGLSDAIPIVGTGVIMIPWILWQLISGNMFLVFGLAIIYVLGIVVRQIMEPKIVGSQIGLHPLATLIAMYLGLRFFGILGMFIGPISIIVVKNLQDAGVLKIWNS